MYDLIIIGGGPAGLTAGIYAQRARLRTLLLEKEIIGGQIAVSDIIENYPGFPSISGAGLMEKFEQHARGLGLEIKLTDVIDIQDTGKTKIVKTSEGDLTAMSVIVATGAKPKRLGIPGEKEWTGKGVSYCATCDGPFFRNQRVLVVGGGDTAVKEAVYLSKIAGKVYLAHRRDQLRAEKIIQEKALAAPNIEMLWSHVLKEIKGKIAVEKIVLQSLKDNTIKELDAEGVFIFVGINPTTDFVDVEKDGQGFIKADENMQTSAQGIFAAGDCRTTPLKQVSTAVGDGAIAAFMAEKYIEELSYTESNK
ncbi:MAG: thioredoxin-disulfide reductase [Deltaproteobacteria bacterium RIFCSPLOWO2_12_FULL_43_16]|nr:MAG: thioredoxin-disulfide reductase [Deltaproteobacteria bacterium GWA2_43_19]OGQ10518.1 MAG: thioredoxin-disulfide reductase [Deltaproteobacteria bacterium RIFCSPHIGHO2_02_FULL_43_33]OGQ59516.1 MAG: thioredoxin-disulfide reductase [Deltaproteobacteria bacterium RIFCSPLOWO2_12_FULL_43_16]HBR16568.1 thioredoxin-disulfide reductase [Deltaproteobacteria bacterium]